MHRGLALLGFLLAGPVSAEEAGYRDAYLSHAEGRVSLQRASESEPVSPDLNVPILPGDRVWTHSASRAEIRFDTGLVIHLSYGTKLDFVSRDSETILRLWSGSAIVRAPEPPPSIRIDSPAGSIRPAREASFRIDVGEEPSVTLSVERGSVELASSLGTVLIQGGETSLLTLSSAPSIPVKFNTARLDDFDRWSAERVATRSRTQDIIIKSLPHAVQGYADDLSDHGAWSHEPEYGYVWYPRVAAFWAPYTYGYWSYLPYGHTWISYEPWGWAPYHYGRWGHGHRGWYWIPGATWGPAWVSFALGPTWVGWSPLGYYGGPVFAFSAYYGGSPFGYYGGRHHRGGWNVCSRDDFRSGYVTREGYRRLDPESVRASSAGARVVDGVQALDRDLVVRGTDPGSPASAVRRAFALDSRSEQALRGFRERAADFAPRVLGNPPSASPRTVERVERAPEVGRRARELPSEPRPRESFRREAQEVQRSFRREAPETARPSSAPAETRERIGRERDPVRPFAPGAETRGSRAGRSEIFRSSARGASESTRTEGRSASTREIRSEPASSGTRGRAVRERSAPASSGSPARGSSGGRASEGRGGSSGRSARPRSN
jgi:hypothetical protein